MSSRRRTRTIVVVAAVFAVLALLVTAWAVDSSRQAGRTARGLSVAGRPIGGLTETELRSATAALATRYEDAWVSISTPAGTLDTTAGAIGLQLDQEAIVDDALTADDRSNAASRPFTWAKSLVASRTVPLRFTIDADALAADTTELDTANRVAPTEPSVAAVDGIMTVLSGREGAALDLEAMGTAIVAAAQTGTTPVRVDVEPVPTPPTYSDADAKAVADQANTVTANPLVLSIGGKSASVVSGTLRSWLTAAPGPNGLQLQADQAKIVADLPSIVTDIGVAPIPATFTVNGENQVEIVDGQLGLECCAPDSAERIAAALVSGQATATLDLWPIGPEHDKTWAQSLGIIEPVSSFTTPHAPGEPRVINIHRIADMARGMVIEPGETFSLNERIGQRTAEKGFVEAGVIYDDEHTTDIGGGVSQFATTTFNAAFFAGLDFDEYQSHTEIIDRYPVGREATVSWPSPDLKFTNNTPYGILVWTSYTDTSVTVTFYSTRYATGEQTGQTTEPKGPCTRYITERTRTWVDGRTDVDHVYGVYGKSCY